MTVSHFFAYIARMRNIRRWSLMRNSVPENDMEHAAMCAIIAHALCVISNTMFGGDVNADKAASIALYHDATEVITGDAPTPVKYLSPEVTAAHKSIEEFAGLKLRSMLPNEFEGAFDYVLNPDKNSMEYRFVKAADTICAYVKCVEEMKYGNSEFEKAAKSTKAKLDALNLKEVDYFLCEFVYSFSLTLDELN